MTESDNFTETSSSGLTDQLDIIDFKLGITPQGHHNHYICKHCNGIVMSLYEAKLHYMEKHQVSDAEKKAIGEIMTKRKVDAAYLVITDEEVF